MRKLLIIAAALLLVHVALLFTGRGGQASMLAVIATADARAQPSKRAGIADGGAGTFADRMNESSAANAPAAK